MDASSREDAVDGCGQGVWAFAEGGRTAGGQAAGAGRPAVTTVADLAARAGLGPPQVRIARTRSVAHVRATRAGTVLVLDPTLLAADRRVLRAVARPRAGPPGGSA